MLQEAFQILLHLTETNFAALNIPEENNNQVYNNNKAVIIYPKILSQVKNRNSLILQPKFNLKVSHLIENQRGQEIRGIFEIFFPILQNPLSVDQIKMNNVKFLEDSQEPMEIEEISYTETTVEFNKPIKIEKDVDTSEKLHSKSRNIIRESKLKLPNDFKEQKNNGADIADKMSKDSNDDKKTETISENSKSQDPSCVILEEVEILNKKSKLRSLVKRDETKSDENDKSYFYHFWQMLFFILFPIAVLVTCVSIAREEFDSEICEHKFDATKAIRDLENRVFGQPKAIQELGFHLSVNFRGLKIISIIGGTGVGKSYAAHIISENFPAKKNVFQYVPPLKQKRRFASGAISVCGCNLIIIENLNNKDISEMINFVEYIDGKIDTVNYCVLIIEVINVQETDDKLKREVNLTRSKTDIEYIHSNKNLDIKIVQFQRLNDEAITKCILDAAKNSNITLSENDIDDVRISLKISDTGCKGARAKVHLLDKKLGFI